MAEQFVGVDIAKKTFEAAKLTNDQCKNKEFSNNEKGFQKFCEWLGKNQSDKHICMEATGPYWKELATFLNAKGYKVSVVNPACIRSFAASELKRLKTDKVDAQVIARFTRAMSPAPWEAPSVEVQELQALVRYREALKDMRIQESNRIQSPLVSGYVKEAIQKHLEYLEQEEKRILCAIEDHMREHATLKRQSQLLVSIPGIGMQTAAILLAEIGNVDLFDTSRKLVAYAGLAPMEIRSGTSVRGRTRLSKIGNAHIRRALFMPAMTGRACNPHLMRLNERLVSAGKNKKAAIGACMRKLLILAFAVLRHGRPYDPIVVLGKA
jgi:transposase